MNATLNSGVITKQSETAPRMAHSVGSSGSSLNEHGPARILVVDDQPSNIQIINSVLGSLGHKIIAASDGASALKHAALDKPDLILLDVLMPEIDGCEVCRRLKLNPNLENIPVIFLSAADDKDLIVRALDSGGVDYITKPFNRAELISRVRTQLALKFACDRLKHLAEDKDELIFILTHDLKNNIGDISMSAMFLHQQHKKINDGKLMQASENILRSSELLLTFVKEFLANATTDYGFALNPVPIDPAKIAERIVDQYKNIANRKKIKIETNYPETPITTLVDSSALQQILDNLISNALKFSPPNKKVFVSVRATREFIELEVRDEGPGFKVEDKPNMFRRYGRLSARPTGGEPSTGLGLSIVNKLTQAVNGMLECSSISGDGATFTIRLPRTGA